MFTEESHRVYVTDNWLLQFRNNTVWNSSNILIICSNDNDKNKKNELINKLLLRIMEHITNWNKTTYAKLTDSMCW